MSIEIVRERLVIRSWRLADAEALGIAIGESLEHIRPFLAWVSQEPKSVVERRALLARWNAEAAVGGDENVGLFLDGRIVGGSGLHQRIGAGGLEIGYWVHPGFTRQGIASSTARALTDHAFTMPAIDRVEIKHDAANRISGRVPARLGFRCVGEEPREIGAPAETGVHLVWRVTRDEWLAARGT
jgi:RimJ/RimL family protein N-acetyltransferase